jgi:hypothetical protein
MERTKNALLFVIALCLVLIVLRLYSFGDFVSAAQAAPAPSSGASSNDVHLYACGVWTGDTCNRWAPVLRGSTGGLWVDPAPPH